MGWVDMPPEPSLAKLNSFAWIDQIRLALLERSYALGETFWPRPPMIHAGPCTISAQGVESGHWYVDFTPAISPGIFTPNTPINYGDPEVFAAVVDDPDPTKCVRLGNVGGASLVDGTRLYLTPPPAHHPAYLDYAVVVGKPLYIITGYAPEQSPWWSERWFQPPNDVINEGTVQPGAYTPAPGVLYDVTIGGKAGTYAGAHLWYGGQRFTITAADDHSITFANPNVSPLPTPTAGTPYVVIHAAGYYQPANTAQNAGCWKWHNVPSQGFYAYDPNTGQRDVTSLQATTVPVATAATTSPLVCTTENRDCTATDQWIPAPNLCDEADAARTPYIFRTLRGVQIRCENLTGSFVKNQSYEGWHQVPHFTVATWFDAAGINSSDDPTYISDAPETSEEGFWWACIDTTETETVLGQGQCATLDDLPDIRIRETNGIPHETRWVYARGWTRTVPNEFKYAYPRTAFVPAQYDETVDGHLVRRLAHPPTAAHPGLWETRPVSTHLNVAGLDGSISESSKAYDAIIDGMKARYMGDNQNDPGLTETVYVEGSATYRRTVSTAYTGDLLDTCLDFADLFFEGLDINRPAVGDAGTVASATSCQLTATDRHWWRGGELRMEEGTCDAADSYFLMDSTKLGNGLWASATGRWQGFTLEIEVATGVWEKRFIDSYDESVPLIGCTEMMPDMTGKAYRIREPKGRLNFWRDKVLRVSTAEGELRFETPILGNDDTTLFFVEQSDPPEAGDTYEIIEMLPGAVYERIGGAWVLPEEAGGSHKGACNLNPDTRTRYGRARKRDYLTATMFTEIKNGINALTATKEGTVVWKARGAPDTPENNYVYNDQTMSADSNYSALIADALAQSAAAWAAAMPGTELDGAPAGGDNGGVTLMDTGFIAKIGVVSKRAAYAFKDIGFTPAIAGEMDFYGIAKLGASSPDGKSYHHDFIVDGVSHWLEDGIFDGSLIPKPNETDWSVATLSLFDTQSVEKNTRSGKVGDLEYPKPISVPAQPIEAVAPLTLEGTAINRGAGIVGSETVIRWDVDGGMSFIADS